MRYNQVQIGFDNQNKPIILNLSECPHILISGSTQKGMNSTVLDTLLKRYTENKEV